LAAFEQEIESNQTTIEAIVKRLDELIAVAENVVVDRQASTVSGIFEYFLAHWFTISGCIR
jgi:hypothetical protein